MRPAGWVVLGLVTTVVALAALTAWQGWSAMQSARDGNVALAEFRERLLDRDVEGAGEALGRAQAETSAARSALGGPHWAALTWAPGIGDDVAAARQLAATADDVTQGALPAAMTALSYADPREIGFVDGGVELEPLRQASGQLSRAAQLLRAADDDASAIATDGLVSALRDRVVTTQEQLTSTSRLATSAAVAGELLPGMLGGDGPRDYLLIAQNTAEQRSLGGIAGSLAVLRADDGRIRLVDQSTPGELGTFEESPLPLTDAEVALYGAVLGRFPANVTDTPDFPRAAQLIKAMWEEREGGELDGVASVDPWALQLLLGAVGPVETEAGVLDGDNAAETLLVDVYEEFSDPEEQNAVLAAAAREVFDRVRSFDGDPRELTRALAAGVDEGRVMVWSAVEEEQEVLAGIPLGRALANPDPSVPRAGVYLHDRTQSKMSTYQRVEVELVPDSCGTTESMQMRVQVRSEAPADRDLPESVTGSGERVEEPGDMFTQLIVYAPEGWQLDDVETSDGRRDLITFRHDGLWAGTRDFLLQPGQSEEVVLTMTGPSSPSNWDVRHTPGTNPANVSLSYSGCT